MKWAEEGGERIICLVIMPYQFEERIPAWTLEATFYTWKKKYGHLGVSELRRLRQLEEENARLKRVVADLTLDKHILMETIRKNR